MPGWDPFVGLTLFVLAVLLGLARLSQGTVRQEPTEPGASGAHSPAGGETTGDSPPSQGVAAASGGPGVPDDPNPERPGEGPTADRELTTRALLANVALTQGLIGVVVAAGAWYYGIPAGALGVGGELTWPIAVGAGVAFGLALWTASELAASVADAVGATYDERLRGLLAPESGVGWLLLLGGILPTIAIVEELLFRAALIGVPAAGYGLSPWWLVVASSVAFALGHGAQGRVGIAVTGGLGLALGAGYVLSGSLAVVAVAHYLVNALEFLVHEGLALDRLL